MGLFDGFKDKSEGKESRMETDENSATSIEGREKAEATAEEELGRQAFQDAPMERQVITFEERKKISVPSERGLYVAEILLLGYCSKYSYPKADGEYPEFWWTEYGIQDVNDVLKSLEKRGFLKMGSLKESVGKLSIFRIREILRNHGQPVSGRKADLVKRVAETVSENGLVAAGVEQKYMLTELGEQELNDNRYVVYMHEYPYTTSRRSSSGGPFDVWSINRMLGKNGRSEIKGEQEDPENKE